MAKGRELVIAVSDGAVGFDAICVTETRSLTINNEPVDITKPDCLAPGGKLESAAMYGIQQFVFTGAGAFVNAASKKKVIADTVNQVIENYQVTAPDIGTFVGDALLTANELSGDKTNELQMSFTVQFSGRVTFTPAA